MYEYNEYVKQKKSMHIVRPDDIINTGPSVVLENVIYLYAKQKDH
jgi:hypothetical protein